MLWSWVWRWKWWPRTKVRAVNIFISGWFLSTFIAVELALYCRRFLCLTLLRGDHLMIYYSLHFLSWFNYLPFFSGFGFSDISTLLKTLNRRVDSSTTFSICVTREGIVERGLKQWKRQKRSSPKNPLRVTFIGEAGIDNGALRNEFLTGNFSHLQYRFM